MALDWGCVDLRYKTVLGKRFATLHISYSILDIIFLVPGKRFATLYISYFILDIIFLVILFLGCTGADQVLGCQLDTMLQVNQYTKKSRQAFRDSAH